MAEIRVNSTGGVKFYDADDSHYAQIKAGTITSDTDVLTLGHDAVVAGTKVDLNGQELILDADADTSITADTNDQIDVRIAGADDFQFTANTFTAQSGSSIVVPDGGLTFGSTAISSTAAELNILDGVTSTTAELNILDGVTATATELNLLDGGTSVGSSITVADADGFVVNDGGTMKTIPATDIKTYTGGGTLVKTGQTTLGSTTSAVTVDNCFTSDYANYLVIMEDFTNTVDSQTLRMALRTGGGSGSTDTANQYRYASRYFQDDGNVDSNTGIDQGQFTIATNNEENVSWKGFCGMFTFYQPQVNDSTRYTGNGSFIQNNVAHVTAAYYAGHYDSDAVHTGLTVYFGSGDIRAGAKIVVYGISEA